MLNQLPPLNSLKTFAIAAQYLSFKQAAKVLNVTPTAVSHQIRALEAQLNISLFERQVRSIQLTPEGEKLAETSLSILKQLQLTIEEIKTPHDKVSVSCCTSFASLWLAPRLADFNLRYPEIDIEICASNALVELEHDRRIDIAIRYGLTSDDPGECFLVKEQLACFARPDFLNSIREDRKAHPPNLFVTEWEDDFLPNIEWRSHFTDLAYTTRSFNQEQFALQAALAGQGYTLISDVLVESTSLQGWLVEDSSMPKFAGYNYSYRCSPYSGEKHQVRIFAQWLEEQMAQS